MSSFGSDGDSDDEDGVHELVIDNGSSSIFSGFGGDDGPRSVIPSLIAYINNSVIIGDDAKEKHPKQCTEPIEYFDFIPKKEVLLHGFIRKYHKKSLIKDVMQLIDDHILSGTDWNAMEHIWRYIFYNQLRVQPEERAILFTEPPLNPKINRIKTTEIMFENFSVPAFYLANTSSLAQYASGRTTGCSVNMGYKRIDINTIYEGYLLPHASTRMSFGGKDLTNYLSEILKTELNLNIDVFGVVDEIKKKLGDVRCDGLNEMSRSKIKKYELPDGSIISSNEAIMQCTEALFDPQLIGKQEKGIHHTIFETIAKNDRDLLRYKGHRDPGMYGNIILHGSASLSNNLQERLQQELRAMKTPDIEKIWVVAPPDRKYSAWIGGSILVSLSTFRDEWVSRDDYQEFGYNAIHRKCFR